MEGLECFVEATRSLNDEFGSAISGDISLISGSYMIILAYTIFNLSSTPLLKSRIVLSLGAIVVRPLGGAFFFALTQLITWRLRSTERRESVPIKEAARLCCWYAIPRACWCVVQLAAPSCRSHEMID